MSNPFFLFGGVFVVFIGLMSIVAAIDRAAEKIRDAINSHKVSWTE